MIFKPHQLEGIRSGTITLAFRKWKKPSVRKGSRIKTEMAVVEITDISEIALQDITEQDSINAGFNTLEDLLEALDEINEGHIYKIKVRFYSEDPRIELREQRTLLDKDFQVLKKKLERLDSYSKEGAWTIEALKAIRDHPELRAADLAFKLKKEKDPLKINIRKLKNLGLTISHEVGYSLSPLGEFVLERLLPNT
jgi:hypothetical protein